MKDIELVIGIIGGLGLGLLLGSEFSGTYIILIGVILIIMILILMGFLSYKKKNN